MFKMPDHTSESWLLAIGQLQAGDTYRSGDQHYLITNYIDGHPSLVDRKRVVDLRTGEVSLVPEDTRVQPTDIHVQEIEDQEPF